MSSAADDERGYRSSYSNHYRRGLIRLLSVLEFRSNNAAHRPVLDALELIARYARHSSLTYYPSGESIHRHAGLEGDWGDLAYTTDKRSRERVVRMIYEIATWEVLRDQLRCKEIWVLGADRWRNPNEDLPQDFEQRRTEHYAALSKPLDPSEFIEEVRSQMRAELQALHRAMPEFEFLEIADRGKQGAVKLTPLPAQPDPANLKALKRDIHGRWGMVPLIDMLKESILRTSWRKIVSELARGARLSEDTLAERLMLALFAYGTNTGIRQSRPVTMATPRMICVTSADAS